MKRSTNKYANYVEHPRYGRGPCVTGLNPSPFDEGVQLHYNATTMRELAARYRAIIGKDWPHTDLLGAVAAHRRIPNTAIEADCARQTPATVAVTHYFDIERTCRDCGRRFIFFAREQKYWYEELGFGLDSDCVRCVDCRKRQQGIERTRERYEALFHVKDRGVEQHFEMATCCLALIEAGVFTRRKAERVRMLLNLIPENAELRGRDRFADAMARLAAVERDPA